MTVVKDKFGRSFKTLRLSLLNACNLSCTYCVPGKHADSLKQHQQPASGFLGMVAPLHNILSLETIRLTGGEPLLYQELPALIRGLQAMGIPNIRLTTNGFLLAREAAALKQAGLQAVNVSLDALEEPVFFRMSNRKGVQRVIAGIDAALAAGLEVKLNAVIMRSLNEDQVLPLVRFAFSRNIKIRFLEVMAMGHLHEHADQCRVSQAEILAKLATAYRFERITRTASATAVYWQTAAGNQFGVVANETEPFCADCNRLRLDAKGNLYGCLSSSQPIAINAGDSQEVLQQKLQLAMNQKQEVAFAGSKLSMLDIGG